MDNLQAAIIEAVKAGNYFVNSIIIYVNKNNKEDNFYTVYEIKEEIFNLRDRNLLMFDGYYFLHESLNFSKE